MNNAKNAQLKYKSRAEETSARLVRTAIDTMIMMNITLCLHPMYSTISSLDYAALPIKQQAHGVAQFAEMDRTFAGGGSRGSYTVGAFTLSAAALDGRSVAR
jgi:hypothetical protein